MKVSATILLSIAILVQTFSMSVIVAGFYLNQSFIALNLCENRDKPERQCQGSCFMKKKIKNESSRQSQMPDLKVNTASPLFLDSFSTPYLLPSQATSPDFFSFDELTTSAFSRSHFHPPVI